MNQQGQTWAAQQAIHARCFHPSKEWEEFPRSALDGSVVDRFEAMVARYPNRLAVKFGAEALTYGELNATANRLASAILAARGEGAEPVAFLIEQGVQAIVAMLGIFKAGKFFIALDPMHPPARVQAILADTQASLLLTNRAQMAFVVQIATADQHILNVDELAHDLPTANPPLTIVADAIAYLVYTSGTTGTPKGVIETHRNVLHYTRVFTNLYHLCRHDRLAATGSNSFSGTPAKIFPALLNGAAVLPFAVADNGVTGLRRWLLAEAITYFVTAPSQFRQLVAVLEEGDHFPHLRLLGTGGDRLRPADVALYRQHFAPHNIFRTSLAFSEIKLAAHYFIDHTAPLPVDHTPVGYCVEGAEVFLVNEEGAPVAQGEVGEIVVRSRYLSPGYWRQPELTAARFRPDPADPTQRRYYTGDMGVMHADGCLVHVGRKDFQVKIRGVRVETAEIEAALWTLDGLKEVVVTARPDAQGETQLVAYLVATAQPTPTVSALRRHLERTLPAAMIPTAFVFLDALPVNQNGKVDLRALPDRTRTRPMLDTLFASPRTPLEKRIATIWQEVLEIEPVGVHDHFLDLGGDSLRAMQVHARLTTQLQSDLAVNLFLERSTVAELANLVRQHQANDVSEQELAQLLATLEAMPEAVAEETVRNNQRDI